MGKTNVAENNVASDLELRSVFGSRLKTIRKEKRLTMLELSNILKQKYEITLSHNTICNYERSYRIPPLFTLSKIADILDVTTDFLLGRTDDRNVKILETSLIDSNNRTHDIKIGVTKDNKITYMGLDEIKELVLILKSLNIDINNLD